ncbi:MAG: GHKL domain-containing protein [Clostridiales bacterium]|jgi:two-component system sensor histidine kinase AgrC|nr:GHKL domain-containing protein [Clostridiales bacterium]
MFSNLANMATFKILLTSLIYIESFLLFYYGARYLFYLWNVIRKSRQDLMIREKQIDAMKTSIEDFNGLKHDFYNILGTYSGYLEVGSLDRLKKYHESVTQSVLKFGSSLDLSKKMDLNPALITLLMNKVDYAQRLNVQMRFQLLGDITNLWIEEIDICRLLSCLIDNALEAAAGSVGRSVEFRLCNTADRSKIISITNSTQGAVDLEMMKLIGYSGKKGHMGVGINNSQKIVNSYDNCHLSFSYYDNEFTACLDIKSRSSVPIPLLRAVKGALLTMGANDKCGVQMNR